MFVVAVAILSFAVASLWQWLKNDHVDLSEQLSGGEGFLVTIAITADALGRAAESKNLHSFRALTCGLVLVAALIGFVFTASGRQDQRARITAAINDVKSGQTKTTRDALAKMSDADRIQANQEMLASFKTLLAEEEKQPYDTGRIARMSAILILGGFVCSFWVILFQEEK